MAVSAPATPPLFELWSADTGRAAGADRTSGDDEVERSRRLRMWRERLPQGSYTWPPLPPDDPRAAAEVRPAQAATLTPLGRKLLGLERW